MAHLAWLRQPLPSQGSWARAESNQYPCQRDKLFWQWIYKICRIYGHRKKLQESNAIDCKRSNNLASRWRYHCQSEILFFVIDHGHTEGMWHRRSILLSVHHHFNRWWTLMQMNWCLYLSPGIRTTSKSSRAEMDVSYIQTSEHKPVKLAYNVQTNMLK